MLENTSGFFLLWRIRNNFIQLLLSHFAFECLLFLAVTFDHFEILRAIGKGSFGKVSSVWVNQHWESRKQRREGEIREALMRAKRRKNAALSVRSTEHQLIKLVKKESEPILHPLHNHKRYYRRLNSDKSNGLNCLCFWINISQVSAAKHWISWYVLSKGLHPHKSLGGIFSREHLSVEQCLLLSITLQSHQFYFYCYEISWF